VVDLDAQPRSSGVAQFAFRGEPARAMRRIRGRLKIFEVAAFAGGRHAGETSVNVAGVAGHCDMCAVEHEVPKRVMVEFGREPAARVDGMADRAIQREVGSLMGWILSS